MPNKSKIKIFVVEDDEWYREYISYTLSLDTDNEVQSFANGKSFLDALSSHPDIVTIDFSLPDTDGSILLQAIKSKFPDTEVIVISEQDKVETALQLLKSGAYDYFVKSKDIRDRLLNTIHHIKRNRKLVDRIQSLEQLVIEKFDFRKNIIGSSTSMQKVYELIEKSLSNNLMVTITGETGTGKEEVAKAIHFNSINKDGPFVTINMAAIPKELAESELFGHEKGAFTGAVTTRAGKFEEANGGTIFLDEIGDMDLSLQVKILRVLQEKTVTKIGSNKQIKINCRVIVATHKNLQTEVDKGNFREDLFYRIYGLTIQLPPLRERDKDILLLADYFIERFCKENNLKVKKLSENSKIKLMEYPFPGNVRELKSLIELSCVLSSENTIEVQDLNFSKTGIARNSFFQNEFSLDDYMRKIIRHYLEQYDNNVTLVAKLLDIGKTTIYRMMKDEKGI